MSNSVCSSCKFMIWLGVKALKVVFSIAAIAPVQYLHPKPAVLSKFGWDNFHAHEWGVSHGKPRHWFRTKEYWLNCSDCEYQATHSEFLA